MKDHWEFKSAQELAEFLRKQESRLNYPSRQEMETMTDPPVSDSVLGQAYHGQLDPKRCKARTLAGIASLASATPIVRGVTSSSAPRVKQKCPHCAGTGLID